MSADLRDLYQEIILEHSRKPKNSGVLEDSTGKAQGNNPLCGDRITVYLKLDGDDPQLLNIRQNWNEHINRAFHSLPALMWNPDAQKAPLI